MALQQKVYNSLLIAKNKIEDSSKHRILQKLPPAKLKSNEESAIQEVATKRFIKKNYLSCKNNNYYLKTHSLYLLKNQ